MVIQLKFKILYLYITYRHTQLYASMLTLTTSWVKNSLLNWPSTHTLVFKVCLSVCNNISPHSTFSNITMYRSDYTDFLPRGLHNVFGISIINDFKFLLVIVLKNNLQAIFYVTGSFFLSSFIFYLLLLWLH